MPTRTVTNTELGHRLDTVEKAVERLHHKWDDFVAKSLEEQVKQLRSDINDLKRFRTWLLQTVFVVVFLGGLASVIGWAVSR
jgi:hypothetical protein